MIGIIIALHSEAKHLIDKLQDVTQTKITNKPAFVGKLNGKKVVIVVCGIGKVSSAIATQKVIDTYSPQYIINVGSCGGTNNSVKVKEFYLIDKCIQFDFDVTEIDNVEIGYIQEYDMRYFPAYTNLKSSLQTATLATADRFSSKEQDILTVSNCECNVRDMEGGAIAQTCFSNNVPFICIKGISDVHGQGSNAQQFKQNLESVCLEIPKIVNEIIQQL
ncbi:MAG: 5'-methylthioadenosine/S-adenosylhomocysteine nucleosidase [Clostridia bacterium]|nr:5'-methylthioadenosine/S-adenosylhomocysteine nucleosidase [Clostridia bacterium]